MNIIETLRSISVENLFQMNTFDNCFPHWKPKIIQTIGETPTYNSILNLGDNLKDIFSVTAETGRTQSSVSGGGASWEGLACWYMNLCLMGSRTVVIKHAKKLIPRCIADSITVNYGSFVSNTESDLIAITFPNDKKFVEDISILTEDGKIDVEKKLNELCVEFFEKLKVAVIQCKTNWNDNAQIPMLWEIVYSSRGFENRNITIGKNGFSMKDLDKFSYSFLTVPTGKSEYKTTSVAVKRVYNLSGGNYWGQPSKSGISNSIKEIFNRNFSNGWILGSQRNDLNNKLKDSGIDDYFSLSL